MASHTCPVDRREPLLGEEVGGHVGTVDLEALAAVAQVGETDVVQHAGEEQQRRVEVADPAVLGEQHGEQVTADAVVGDGRRLKSANQGERGARQVAA